MHRLIILEDNATPREVEPGSRELSIGRSSGESIVLHDKAVSREHALVRRLGDRITIQDVGSRGGTFVNERRLDQDEAVTLRPGDIVRMGSVQVLCRGPEPVRDLEQSTRDAAFAAQANARLLVLDGELLRRRALARPVNLIGGGAHCQIRLTGRDVPPEHVVLRAIDGAFRLEPRSTARPVHVGPAQTAITDTTLLPSNTAIGLGEVQLLFLYDYGSGGAPVEDPLASIPRRRLLKHVAAQTGLQIGVLKQLCKHRKKIGQCLGEILIEQGHITPLFWSVVCARLLS